MHLLRLRIILNQLGKGNMSQFIFVFPGEDLDR